MKEHSIKTFLRMCGIREVDMDVSRGYVNAPCIFAHWNHTGGKDQHPSFGISINDEGESIYFCFGCSDTPERVSGILHQFWLLTGTYPHDLANFYLKNEIFGEDQKPIVQSDGWSADLPWKEPPSPIPWEIIDLFPLLQGARTPQASACMAYFIHERNVSNTVVFHTGVRYSPKGFVVYPMTNIHGDIFLLRARSIYQKKIWTISPDKIGYPELTFPSLRESGALFGVHLIDWSKPVMLVEGGEDALRLMSLGYWNVVASMTTGFTEAQINELVAAPALIVGYDDDTAGDRSFYKILQKLRGKVPIFRVRWTEAGIGRTGKPCKDSGDLLTKEQLAKVLSEMSNYS